MRKPGGIYNGQIGWTLRRTILSSKMYHVWVAFIVFEQSKKKAWYT